MGTSLAATETSLALTGILFWFVAIPGLLFFLAWLAWRLRKVLAPTLLDEARRRSRKHPERILFAAQTMKRCAVERRRRRARSAEPRCLPTRRRGFVRAVCYNTP